MTTAQTATALTTREEQPVVITVTDSIDGALAGREGGTYVSPPQSRERALELVAFLLGRPAQHLDGETRWSCVVAGGRRVITLNGSRNGSKEAPTGQ